MRIFFQGQITVVCGRMAKSCVNIAAPFFQLDFLTKQEHPHTIVLIPNNKLFIQQSLGLVKIRIHLNGIMLSARETRWWRQAEKSWTTSSGESPFLTPYWAASSSMSSRCRRTFTESALSSSRRKYNQIESLDFPPEVSPRPPKNNNKKLEEKAACCPRIMLSNA